MRVGTLVALALAAFLVGCTTIEIHGSDRVDIVRRGGIGWSLDVKAAEPVLIDRTSFGLDMSFQDFILGFRRSRSVYRPVSSDCHVLIVVDSQSDADEAIDILTRTLRSTDGAVCLLRK